MGLFERGPQGPSGPPGRDARAAGDEGEVQLRGADGVFRGLAGDAEGDVLRWDGTEWIADQGIQLPVGLAIGDLLVATSGEAGIELVRIPIGTEGQVLTVVDGMPTWGAGAPALLDPATLVLTGYWKPTFTTSPWTGTASAGTSGGRQLVAGGGATAGAGGSADFNGAGHFLAASGFQYDELLTRPAYFMQVVFEADTAAAPAVLQPYNDECIVADNGGNLYIGFTTSGIQFGHYDDATFKSTRDSGGVGLGYIACSTGAKHCVQAWYDGTNLNVRVDGGAVKTLAAGNLTTAFNAILPRIGANNDASACFDGRIYQFLTMASVPASDVRNDLLASAQDEFGF